MQCLRYGYGFLDYVFQNFSVSLTIKKLPNLSAGVINKFILAMIIEAKVAGCIYTYFQHCIIVLRLLRGSFGSLGLWVLGIGIVAGCSNTT